MFMLPMLPMIPSGKLVLVVPRPRSPVRPAFLDPRTALTSNARFSSPVSLSVDALTNLYVADSTSHILRRITPIGTNWVVTTIGGEAGMPGSADGVGTTARFDLPGGIALDGQGKLYIADTGNNTIRSGVSVTESVSLQISESTDEIIVSWPVSATGYALQTSTDLINWTPVAGVSGSEYVISNSTATTTVFYRLYKP
jgi:hypothetical protein